MAAVTDSGTEQRQRVSEWVTELRDRICMRFEEIEDAYCGQLSHLPAGRFVRTAWKRAGENGADAGGGMMSVMKGRVFEKVGVNISMVHGKLTEDFARTIPGAEADPTFWAAGISLVAHMQNPHVPAAHMNTRHMVTRETWFGGGADLTPMFDNAQSVEDAAAFHAALKQACDAQDAGYYPRFSKWCDEYFFLPHRNEPRGAGGIFYDRLNSGNWQRDFAFMQEVGLAFLEVYPQIVRRRMEQPFSEADRAQQLLRRGRYVEFNLLYDRGTQFGLKTGGNIDAILMSLPPEARWA
ncbi:MAG: oxygen-dependent coproporphyrinogen oxidase [Alphaproteobacteria bacterium]|nr:oxygen-dependent coproporphyrinogen oxidase [Alphaproteobacteria bacterium]